MARPSQDRIQDLLKQNKLTDDQKAKFQRLYDQSLVHEPYLHLKIRV